MKISAFDPAEIPDVCPFCFTAIRSEKPLVIPPICPPIIYKTGAENFPNMAYAFTNEPGLVKKLKENFSGGAADSGAVIGVSGSVLDVASFVGKGKCELLISIDINKATSEAVALLEKLLSKLDSVETGKKKKKLSEFIGPQNWNIYTKEDTMASLAKFCGVANDAPLQGIMECAFARTVNKSEWFKDEGCCEHLIRMVKMRRFRIVCGDLQAPETQKEIRNLLASSFTKVSVLNLSNAMDYMGKKGLGQLEGFVKFLKNLMHTSNAKIITSTKVGDLEKILGTFDDPVITDWDKLLSDLEKQKGLLSKLVEWKVE
jgi:hypothetical protein